MQLIVFFCRQFCAPSNIDYVATMVDEMETQLALAYTVWILLQLLSAPHAYYLPSSSEEDDDRDTLGEIVACIGQPVYDPLHDIRALLHNYRLCTSLTTFDDDLGYWVKRRSMTWFWRFLLSEYDDTRWVQMFRMTKTVVYALADFLRPHVMKKDTNYRLAIPMVIQVACCLFKLTHGAFLFICSEIFAVGKSTVSAILRDVVHVINDTLRHELIWPTG